MIEEKIGFLLNINDEEWGQYAFSRDPLKGKVSDELRREIIEKANECGKKEAIKLKEKYEDVPIRKIIKMMDLEFIENIQVKLNPILCLLVIIVLIK